MVKQVVLQGKTVVLTGASSGLGRAAAIELGRKRAKVLLAARRAEALEDAAEQCRRAGGQAWAVVTDVTSEQDVSKLANYAVEQTGAQKIIGRFQPLCLHDPYIATGAHMTRSMRGAPVASIARRSKPSAMPLAAGMRARAERKSSSSG